MVNVVVDDKIVIERHQPERTVLASLERTNPKKG
jgi:hypothetical protein